MAKYWVGWTWNWSDDTNHWATTSGGAPWAWNLPTATDDVIFDTLSNATAYTCTIDATTKLCRDITFWAPLAWNMTWAWSVAMTISGSMTLYAGLIRTYTGALTFNATSTGKTITMNGVSLSGNVTFNWVWWGWILQDTFTWSSNTIPITAWTFDSNNQAISSWANFNSTWSWVRTITLWSSTIQVSQWFNFSTTTNLTFNSNTSTFSITWWWATLNPWWLTFYNISKVTGSGFDDSLSFGWDCTVGGTITLTWFSATRYRLLVKSNTKWTARTITAAAISVDKVDFQDITGAGAATWDMSAAAWYTGDCWGNSMKALGAAAFTTAATCNWSAGTTWSTATWSNHSIPLPQDTATFTTAWTVTITQDMPRIGSVDFSTVALNGW